MFDRSNFYHSFPVVKKFEEVRHVHRAGLRQFFNLGKLALEFVKMLFLVEW